MREETRYRVTGILFLLALAVICLPMLLDGAGLPARRLPDLPMDDSLPEVQPLARRAPESEFGARTEQLRRQVDDEGFLTRSGTRFGEPVLTPADEEAQRADTEAGEDGRADDGSEPAAHDQAEGVAAAGQGDRIRRGAVESDAWAVQVASFARTGNAEEFRSRLRQDGYEAFISTARADGRVVSRVAVGPLLDRQRAETLRGELSARYDVEARLMAFSN